ncbi:hypothetical protein ACWEOZ_15740 [Actinoplanes sp. NPDC004185]
MRSVLRRARLPLVVSLFLAALLGAPTAAGPVTDPLPAPVMAAAAAAPAAPAPAPLPEEIVTDPPAAATAPAGPVRLAAPLLTDQVSTAATAPRGPPHTA